MSYHKITNAVSFFVFLMITLTYHCLKVRSYRNKIKRKNLQIKSLQHRIKIFESSSIFETIDDELILQSTELNERQKEIVILMLHGFSNTEIASRLFVATTTVKYHIKNIYRIYSVKNKHQLYNKLIVKNDTIARIE
ncbi:LuxR C-terminal-related transcriptional regulator [Chryseobacterium sp. FH1]|uniref:LuxR C-terminal-related transcriptional regulator n=1 Tax=Chryseobacterium sp. FH1 TaxID=1233951 RepID=UPI0004E2936C|nr:LuxR C-terminal-related transcriptional regulator [Chryseobacterium sp. FH1]KFC20352.1 hypothetical protein IO90_14400 [Chryseobacterium sp. FH1]